MAADNSPSNFDMLASDDVVELFGWPVSLLDQIRELASLAHCQEIEIDEWRRRDAELRAAGPAQPASDQIGAARKAVLEARLEMPADKNEAEDRLLRLTSRLDAALHGAPDDDKLRERLRHINEMLGSPDHRVMRTRLQQDRALVTRWLASSAQTDEITGLPWDHLARYRWLPDPALGTVPAFLGVARHRALSEAPDEMKHLARQLQPDTLPYPATAELDQLALTRFPSRIIEAASRGDKDAAAVSSQVLHLWQGAETQRFLLRETARGWPENLRQADPPPQ